MKKVYEATSVAILSALLFATAAIPASATNVYRTCINGPVRGYTGWHQSGSYEDLFFVKNTGSVTESWRWYRNGGYTSGGTLAPGRYTYINYPYQVTNNSVYFAGGGYSCAIYI